MLHLLQKPYCTVRKQEMKHVLTATSTCSYCSDGEKMTLEEEEAITLPLYELELKTGVSISPIVMLKKLWENRPFKTPFYINVTNEGIVL